MESMPEIAELFYIKLPDHQLASWGLQDPDYLEDNHTQPNVASLRRELASWGPQGHG